MSHGFPTGYFFLRARNGNVLDVAGKSTDAGDKVIAWEKKRHRVDNQVWYAEDGFLINKHSGLVLDIESGKLESGNHICQYTKKPIGEADNQRWGYQNGYIYVLANPDLVLDVAGESEKEGAKIIVWQKKGENDNSNQQWVIENA
ncbi:ricin B lectin domain-containing protein [Jimgerdemannia flammicorona]|uniref:Ricin B lectin domain-containing protein n=2 Tax=Jimgerdemannia flammicorona TaxID=994334 RepID=A0A433QD96_9FUNG|nr:ricin B lectin domain-containing protein [Jimgerdemannia flammicorona]RUS27724.1 ricin B lectin domain-containing protein [Jimgerdemannia flammicorona]